MPFITDKTKKHFSAIANIQYGLEDANELRIALKECLVYIEELIIERNKYSDKMRQLTESGTTTNTRGEL